MCQKVKKEYPKIGLVTVYRTLQLLDRFGFLCKLHTNSNSSSYLLSSLSAHHHHLVCSSCGTVVNFVDCGLQQLEERLTHESGYKIEDHFLEFSGRCQRCLQQKPS
jgi:Fur family ferric uptake transcriptional regulator